MSTPEDPLETTLDDAWDALAEGRSEELLVLLAAVEGEAAERVDLAGEITHLTVEARLGLFDLAGAKRALLSSRAPADDPSLLQARGELALASWDFDAARTIFAALAASAPTENALISAHERLALVADLAGDQARADGHLFTARGFAPTRLTPAAFEAEVATAAAELPPAFRAIFERVPVIIDPVPDRELALGSGRDPLETPPDLLGLFLGYADTEAGSEGGGMPAHIRIFQRNLERMAEDPAHLREEIAKTLYHELGHVLGHDEDGVDALGLR